MTYCTVTLCHNASEKNYKISGVSFHRFPTDPVKASYWVKIIRRCRNEECWNPAKNTRICSIHFEEKYMYKTKTGQRRLHCDAVPTKNLHITYPHQDTNISENRNNAESPSMEPQLDSSTSQEYANKKIMHIQEELHPSTSRITPIEDDMKSIFDTSRKAKLRIKLKKKTLLHIKHSKLIKSLRQKNRLLNKKNKSLKEILRNLKKQRYKQYINNDISNNILSENVFAAELYNSLVKKIKNNKKQETTYA